LLPLALPGWKRPECELHPRHSDDGKRLRQQVAQARGRLRHSKNLYVIIDYHQIDNATTGTSAADATTFWTDIAPQFANYANVIYEPFNEPIDGSASWGL